MPDFALALRFHVVIDDKGSLGSWSKCDGLTVEYEVQEYQEGGQNDYVHRLPGRCKYENIKLTSQLDKTSADVASWVGGQRQKAERSNAETAVLEQAGAGIPNSNLGCVVQGTGTGPCPRPA